ncbi:MAG: RHS repeat-associated core domain-containing protein [Pirellulaceae bacterium]
MYSPILNRFTSRDPEPLEGEPDVLYGDEWVNRNIVARMNLYAYVENNPTNRSDPSGLGDLMGLWPHQESIFVICRNVVHLPQNPTCVDRCGQGSGAKHCDIGMEVGPRNDIELIRHGKGGIYNTCKESKDKHCRLYEKTTGKLEAGSGRGTRCNEATLDMIIDCIKTRKPSPKPFSNFTDNCQTDTYDTAHACCLEPGWGCFIPALFSRSVLLGPRRKSLCSGGDLSEDLELYNY